MVAGGGLRSGLWLPASGSGASCTLICCFLQLPLRICKKVLVIMHDSILPHLAQPTLMIDFLTRAYDIGEQVAAHRAETRGPCTWLSRVAVQIRLGLQGCVSVCRWSYQPLSLEWAVHPDS